MGRAVDNGRVDHCAATACARRHDTGQNTCHQVERAAADISNQRGRRERRFTLIAGIPGSTRQRDIIEIMACGLRPRSGLTPAGHAAID